MPLPQLPAQASLPKITTVEDHLENVFQAEPFCPHHFSTQSDSLATMKSYPELYYTKMTFNFVSESLITDL